MKQIKLNFHKRRTKSLPKSGIAPKGLPPVYVPTVIADKIEARVNAIKMDYSGWLTLVITEELKNPRVTKAPLSVEPDSEKYLTEAKKIYTYVELNNLSKRVTICTKEFLASLRYEIGVPDFEKFIKALMQLCKAGLYEEVTPRLPDKYPEGFKMLKVVHEDTENDYTTNDKKIKREQK